MYALGRLVQASNCANSPQSPTTNLEISDTHQRHLKGNYALTKSINCQEYACPGTCSGVGRLSSQKTFRKNAVGFLLIVVCCLSMYVAFQDSLGVAHAFSGDQLSDPLSSNPVTIDGKFTTPNDWSDALQVTLSSTCRICSGKGLLYIKHDASNFYFLVDFLSVTSLNPSADHASVTIDSAHDGGTEPGPDDVRFDSNYPNGGSMAVGTGGFYFSWGHGLPAGVLIAMSFSASPNSAVPHVIAEFQIPFSIFPNLQKTVGFAADAYVCGQTSPGLCRAPSQAVIWPASYWLNRPATWGELTISSTPISEIGNIWLTALTPPTKPSYPMLVQRTKSLSSASS